MPKKRTNDYDCPTPYDDFLYLLFELERAVEQNKIDWSAANLPLIQDRLLKLTENLAHASSHRSGGSCSLI